MAIFQPDDCLADGADFTVTEVADPDPTGCYYDAGVHNAKRYYEHADSTFFIWHDGAANYVLSAALGDVTAGDWQAPAGYPQGVYEPTAPYTGEPRVLHCDSFRRGGQGQTVTLDGVSGDTIRNTGQLMMHTITMRQRDLRAKFGVLARIWKFDLTEAERIRWGLDYVSAKNRAEAIVEIKAIHQWMNVNFPLLAAGLTPTPPLTPVLPYAYHSIHIVNASAATQRIMLSIDLARWDMTYHRAILFCHQVPGKYLGKKAAWRFAKLCGAVDLETNIIFPNYEYQLHAFDAWEPFAQHEFVEAFIRITHYNDPIPPLGLPISATDSVSDGVEIIAAGP